MLNALLSLALLQPAIEQPTLPMGASPILSRAIDRIARLTEKGDFAAAKRDLWLLPSRQIKVEWDDSDAPESLRFDYGNVRSQVLDDWARFASAAKYTVVEKDGDLKVVFDAGEGRKLVWSETPGEPRLTVQIGLNEGSGTLDPATLNNHFSFAVGSFLGISKIPMAGLVMSGTELNTPRVLKPHSLESTIANGCVLTADRVRSAVMKSMIVRSGLPSVAEGPKPVNFGKSLQGDAARTNFTITNSGQGVLTFKIIPDCTCFRTTQIQQVGAGQSKRAELYMDTTDFFGTVHKTVYLFSNDHTNPIQAIPVDIHIAPRYRILPPSRTYIADDGPVTIEAFLFSPDDRPLTVTSADSQGLPGVVGIEKWTGSLADPDLGEPEQPRRGYKLTIVLDNVPEGSQFGTNIVLSTDDPAFPKVSYPVYVQKGIVASPPNIFMGEVGAAARKMTFAVSRPGKPFRITKVQSDSAHLSATVEPMTDNGSPKPGEYRVTVSYDGRASKGDYRALIMINTDDPKQPVIEVPVTATVRG